MNNGKSTLFYNRNTRLAAIKDLCGILNVMKMSMSNKYLGLPLFVGRSKKKAFDDVKAKVLTKVRDEK